MTAYLALEDGLIFHGRSFGAEGERVGEVVFNTSLTGYQEILTDPSYCGQMVVMTYPLIGNYGVNEEDIESSKPWLEGFIVKENSRIASNFRKTASLSDYLKKHKIVAIDGIDTRKLVKHLRTHGAKMGIISTKDSNPASLIEKAQKAVKLEGRDLAKEVTCKREYEFKWEGKEWGFENFKASNKFHVVAYDFGIKTNILRNLALVGCRVTVVPANTSAEKVMGLKPDGVFLSNGPGDPAAVAYAIEEIKKLLDKKPIFGICLGHQLLGLALGGKTYKLKFGHHGGNQPVKDLKTGKVAITSQNHGFSVDVDSIPGEVELTHINLNDKTVEGMRHKQLPIFSVQYHPEAAPGPHDAEYLFKQFVEMMERA